MNAFRLPRKTHIGQIQLETTNLTRALRFYSDTLGFKMIDGGGWYAALSMTEKRSPQIILTQADQAAFVRGSIKPHLFAIRYPTIKDLAEVYLRLKDMKIPVHGLVHQKVCVSAFLPGPDDFVIELFADLPRSAWRWHNGKLLRSSSPMKDSDFLTVLDQQENNHDMPAEIAIGHIDLSVRDLEEAKKFYCDFLGLVVTGGDHETLILAAGLYHQHLTLRKRTRDIGAADYPFGLTGYRLQVPGMETLYELRKRLEIQGYGGHIECFNPSIGMMCLLDPFGYALEIQSADCGAIVHEEALHKKGIENSLLLRSK